MPERFIPNPSNVEIFRRGCVTDMALPTGEVRIIYGDHSVATDAALIPKSTDGLFLEQAIDQPKTRSQLSALLNGESQYSGLETFAQKSNIPILFHDVSAKLPLGLAHLTVETASYLNVLTPLLMTALTTASIPETLLVTSPFLLDSLAQYIPYITKKSFDEADLHADVYRAVLRAVPYRRSYVLRLRNALWATKINWALENGLGQHFTTIVGPAHVGLEDYLKREAEGKEPKIFRATSRIWPLFAENDSYYTIRRFSQRRPKGAYDDVREYEVPKLKAIALNS